MIRTSLLTATLIAATPAPAQNQAVDDPVTKALLEQLRADQSGATPPASGGPQYSLMSNDALSENLNESLATLEAEGTRITDLTCADTNCEITLQLAAPDPAGFMDRLHAVDTMISDAGPCEYSISAFPGDDGNMRINAAVLCAP